jgi:hypothetical protein
MLMLLEIVQDDRSLSAHELNTKRSMVQFSLGVLWDSHQALRGFVFWNARELFNMMAE